MNSHAIRAKNLHKWYGKFQAVRGISFEVPLNTCFGFLGHNGAGKTTTMRMITGLAEITSGDLEVLGEKISTLTSPDLKMRMGVVPQEDGLDEELTVLENLEYFGIFYGLTREESRRRGIQFLEFMGMAGRENDHIFALSGGLRRRLVIARSLLADPELIILDEPTTGLDPAARRLVWQKLETLKNQGVTLLLTTHYMEEAAMLCDRIAVMSEGIILDEGSPVELIARHATPQVLEIKCIGDLADSLKKAIEPFQVEFFPVSERWFLYSQEAEEVRQALLSAGLDPLCLVQRAGNLEDVYLKLAGKEAEN